MLGKVFTCFEHLVTGEQVKWLFVLPSIIVFTATSAKLKIAHAASEVITACVIKFHWTPALGTFIEAILLNCVIKLNLRYLFASLSIMARILAP